MSTAALRVTVALVRVWTRAYTWHLPADVRAQRRAEIESDLWESQRADTLDACLPAHIVARLVFGVPDDLRWRREHSAHDRTLPLAFAGVTIGAAIVAAVWIGHVGRPLQLPTPLIAPTVAPRHLPPPPPPPPPLCPPSGLGPAPTSPCSHF
jgi:hypothetical protein